MLTRAAAGRTNQAIAQALFLSPRTVHSHIEHLLRKTGAASRAEAPYASGPVTWLTSGLRRQASEPGRRPSAGRRRPGGWE
ncbi:response regulator transcription factor [Streptomyces pseudovenezuelae]|uniref:LuxR C-terminal-related transcriptional regulator n=1 Tax=Streptomyces pseudovenezuelae TaxID=67350 RepID=A0ABZ1WPP2_9ACTN|nr:LuxR C-terminal-related transcriptional regulator [Streptomyces pseudovenezuelae]